MTSNQLKYWELRWKQTYESHQMVIDEEKVKIEAAKLAETIRSNKAKELETKRHNRAMERQDYLDYQVNVKDLERKWKQLDWEIQSGIIRLGIDQQNTANNAYKILSDEFFASMELAFNVQRERENLTVKYLEQYVNATGEFLKAWGGGVTALTIGEIRSAVARGSFDKFEQALVDRYPKLKEFLDTSITNFGPDKSKVDEIINGAVDNNLRTAPKVNDYSKASKDYPRYMGKENTDKDTEVVAQNQTYSGAYGTVVSGKTGARYHENHNSAGSTKQAVETVNSHGTTVVYSPGTHYGPGFIK